MTNRPSRMQSGTNSMHISDTTERVLTQAMATRAAHNHVRGGALQAARQAVLAMRANNEIGDDAFHQIEEELDWLEMVGPRTR